MQATTQLNARMTPELKQAGDEALARIGLTPTAAVRALWEKAAKRGKDLEEVAQLLAPSAEAAATVANAKQESPFEPAREMVREFYRQCGVDPDQVRYSEKSDKELLEEALYERMVERGLM